MVDVPTWVPRLNGIPASVWLDFVARRYWVTPHVIPENQSLQDDTGVNNINQNLPGYFWGSPGQGLFAKAGISCFMPGPAAMAIIDALLAAGGLTWFTSTVFVQGATFHPVRLQQIRAAPTSTLFNNGVAGNVPPAMAPAAGNAQVNDQGNVIFNDPTTNLSLTGDNASVFGVTWLNAQKVDFSLNGDLGSESLAAVTPITHDITFGLISGYNPATGSPALAADTGWMNWLAIFAPLPDSFLQNPTFTFGPSPVPIPPPMPVPLPCAPLCRVVLACIPEPVGIAANVAMARPINPYPPTPPAARVTQSPTATRATVAGATRVTA